MKARLPKDAAALALGADAVAAALKASDGAKLSKAIQALQEPLSKIGAKVATAS